MFVCVCRNYRFFLWILIKLQLRRFHSSLVLTVIELKIYNDKPSGYDVMRLTFKFCLMKVWVSTRNSIVELL